MSCFALQFHPGLEKFKEHLDDPRVDTEVCEQVFSWLKGYGYIVKCMSPASYWWFMHNLVQLHNEHEERKLKRKGRM
jgi:hypothetical protein